jgi:hypothetical protein
MTWHAIRNYDFVRDPEEWKTGDELITDAQREYLSALAAKVGKPIPRDLDRLTKADA